MDGRDFVFATSKQKVLQSLRTRAQIFKGSWRYDRNLGVPYFQDILAAGAGEELVRRRFYELVSETPGVTSVTSVVVRFEGETVYVDFACTALDEQITGTLDFVTSN